MSFIALTSFSRLGAEFLSYLFRYVFTVITKQRRPQSAATVALINFQKSMSMLFKATAVVEDSVIESKLKKGSKLVTRLLTPGYDTVAAIENVKK